MQASEVYRMLSRRMRRGTIIFGVLLVALCVFDGLALADRNVAWAVAVFAANKRGNQGAVGLAGELLARES